MPIITHFARPYQNLAGNRLADSMVATGRSIVISVALTVAGLLSIVSAARAQPRTAVLWEEHYVVRDDGDAQILCDPYTVRPNDWLHKIFFRRGEISEDDFGQFLKIFKRLNPHVDDINRILPGQLILIPLKKLALVETPDPSARQMTIPFAGFANDNKTAPPYRVKAGDRVSALLAARGLDISGNGAEAALQRFKAINPQITDIDQIVPGQNIYLPDTLPAAVQTSPQVTMAGQAVDNDESYDDPPPIPLPPPSGHDTGIASDVAVLGEILQMRALTRGFLYFPMDERNDMRLELRRYPVLVLPEGTHFLFASASDLPGSKQLQVMQNYWPQLDVVSVGLGQENLYALLDAFCGQLPRQNHPDQVTIVENGASVMVQGTWVVKTAVDQNAGPMHFVIMPAGDPALSVRDGHLAAYLARHAIIWKVIEPSGRVRGTGLNKSNFEVSPDAFKVLETADAASFIKALAAALGWQYSANISVYRFRDTGRAHSFAAMLTSSDGRMVIVDSGRMEKEATDALSASGFAVVSMREAREVEALISELLTAMQIAFSVDPEFVFDSQAGQAQVRLQIRGVMAKGGQGDLLLTRFDIDPLLIDFLTAREIVVARLGL